MVLRTITKKPGVTHTPGKKLFATSVHLIIFACMRIKYQVKWDAIGIGASLACAIHCALLPIIFTTITLCGIEVLKNVYLEVLTLLISMSAGGWAIWHGYRKLHHQKNLVIYFFTGLILMIAGNFVTYMPAEMGLKIIGAIFIISAHVKNWRACKHCETGHPVH